MGLFGKCFETPKGLRLSDFGSDAYAPLRFLDGETILSIKEIEPLFLAIRSACSGLSHGDFSRYVAPILVTIAEFCQLTPSSAIHHHSGIGGQIFHLLDTARRCLENAYERSFLIPRELIETTGKTQLATPAQLCLITVAATHDLGKLVTDLELDFYSSKNKKLNLKPYNPHRDGICSVSPYEWYLDTAKHTSRQILYRWKHNDGVLKRHDQYWQHFIDGVRKRHYALYENTAELAPFLLQLDSAYFRNVVHSFIRECDRASAIDGMPDHRRQQRAVVESMAAAISTLGQANQLRPLEKVGNHYNFLPLKEWQRLHIRLPRQHTFQPLRFDTKRTDLDHTAEFSLKLLVGAGGAMSSYSSGYQVAPDEESTLCRFRGVKGAILNEDLTELYDVCIRQQALPDFTLSNELHERDESATDALEQTNRVTTPAQQETTTPPSQRGAPGPSESSGQPLAELPLEVEPHSWLGLDEDIALIDQALMLTRLDFSDPRMSVVEGRLKFDCRYLSWLEAHIGIDIESVTVAAPDGLKGRWRVETTSLGIPETLIIEPQITSELLRRNGISALQLITQESSALSQEDNN